MELKPFFFDFYQQNYNFFILSYPKKGLQLAYFPAFIQLEHKKVLLVGGGAIATEKLEKLLDFTNNITLIASEFSNQIQSLIDAHKLLHVKKSYQEGDIKGYNIVIVAVDDIALQESIYKESRGYNCLYNAVDLPKYCDFIFPSYVKKGDLTVAVSTSGSSPAFAKQFRIYLQKLIPQNVDEFLQEMKAYRKTLPKGKERMKMLEEKAKQYIKGFNK
jgi:precorrin-2 dehydrogenase/sirohydrochlorin ferrochelatase